MTNHTIPIINAKNVTKVYSGRPGCGCGCRGKYSTDARNITRVTNIVNDALTQHGTIDKTIDSYGDEFLRVGMKDGIAYFETEKRYYWVYTKHAHVF